MNRQQRRQLERQQRKGGAKAPSSTYPQGKTEVYAYTDDNGQEQWLDVVGLRTWADAHLPILRVPIDLQRVSDIITSDAIDVEHFKSHTLPNPESARPILICQNLTKGNDQIVDGNHTYVAYGMGVAMAQQEGIEMPVPPSAAGYMIEPDAWKRFVVPPELRGPDQLK